MTKVRLKENLSMSEVLRLKENTPSLSNIDLLRFSELVSDLMVSLERKYPVDLWLQYSKISNTIILSKIVLDKEDRGQGTGTKIMNDICSFADKYKMRIALTPSTDFGGSKGRLIQFYKGFGFKNYKGFEFKETMVREPR
jgi:GNAT superfamily N-acetyltransferase